MLSSLNPWDHALGEFLILRLWWKQKLWPLQSINHHELITSLRHRLILLLPLMEPSMEALHLLDLVHCVLYFLHSNSSHIGDLP